MTSNLANFQKVVAFELYQNLKELQDEVCDVVVTVKGKDVLFHRIVLCLASQKLRTILAENGGHTVQDKDVSSESVEYLKEILYTGKDLSEETAKDILKIALYFEISWLTTSCKDFLLTNLQPKDCLDVWLIAHKHKLLDLVDRACKTAAQNIEKISEELLTLPKSMLMMLLSLQNKLNSDDVCKTIQKWAEANQSATVDDVAQLLPFIQFEHLSPSYLADLMGFWNHPSLRVIFEPIKDVISQILKQKLTMFDETRNISLLVGIQRSRSQDIPIMAWSDFQHHCVLAHPPSNIGPPFGSCVWQNDIYLSGHTTRKGKFFAVYKPADNKWEVLKVWGGDSRQHHAMAAVNSNIYILGGLSLKSNSIKQASETVMKFDIKSETWSLCNCFLPESVYEMTVAVLGHRIYVFGGTKENGEKTDLVQCVDTRSDVAYKAGRLPYSVFGSRALSNGGIIYVVLPTGKVLQMWENFKRAEETPNLSPNLDNLTRPTLRGRPQHVENLQTVEFREMAAISARTDFSACMTGAEIRVYGGNNENGVPLSCGTTINVLSDETKEELAITGATGFDLHVINIPQKHLQNASREIQDITNVSANTSTEQNPPASTFRSSVSSSHRHPDDEVSRNRLPSSRGQEDSRAGNRLEASHTSKSSTSENPRKNPQKRARKQ